ncbi:Hypothetical protein PBC10988_11860 [Planctomycetales bacterium 10988]|nr:Hypothetical protein PBC10988_11860 [Planctomycetales bacterium 10988]
MNASQSWPWVNPFLLAFSLLAGGSPSLIALAAELPLLECLPEGAAAYVEVEELPQNWKRLQSHPLAQRIRNFSVWKSWSQTNLDATEDLFVKASEQLQTDPDQLLNEVLGGSFAFAVWPPEQGEEDRTPRVLFLLESPDAELLKQTVERWQALYTKGLFLKARTSSIESIPYSRYRARRLGKPVTEYITVLGSQAFIANDESLLRDTILCAIQSSNAPHRWIENDAVRETYASGLSAAQVRCLLDPVQTQRITEPELQTSTTADIWAKQQELSSAEPEPAQSRPGPKPWQEEPFLQDLDLLGFSLQTEENRILARGYLHLTKEAHSDWLPFGKPLDLSRGFPKEAFLAHTGRFNIPFLYNKWRQHLSPKEQEELEKFWALSIAFLNGLDPEEEFFARLGPVVGSFVLPAEMEESRILPFDWAAYVEIPEEDTFYRETLESAAASLLRVFALSQNAEHPENPAVVKTRSLLEHHQVTWVEGLRPLPSHWQLSFTLMPRFFYLSSNPEFLASRIEDSFNRENFSQWSDFLADPQQEVHEVTLINFAAFRKHFEENEANYAKVMEKLRKIDDSKIDRILLQIKELSSLADQVMLWQAMEDAGMSLQLEIALDTTN